jgi:HSP20 family protein
MLMKTKRKQNKNDPQPEPSLRLGGIFSGLTGLVEKLNELAQTGQEMSQTGEIGGADKGVKGIYGFTVKVGLGDQGPRVEPFGNIRQDKKTGKAVVQEIREPVVDLFEEKDHLLIVAEMPGISVKDVKLEVKDDVLTIAAARGQKKYRKEVLLPGSYRKEKMHLTCNNGVLEIKCLK